MLNNKTEYKDSSLYGLHEECGVFGVINSNNASYDIYSGLHALQHRGQDASGIVTFDKNNISICKRKGLILQTFTAKDINNLIGTIGIGHARYPTSGGKDNPNNIQPFTFKKNNINFALCHNGNLTNALSTRRSLIKEGFKFISDSDSEILGHLINKASEKSLIEKLKWSFKQIKGAYSYLLVYDGKLIAARDPYGIRPLVLGKKGKTFYLSSETVALDINNATYIRDIEPGEIIIISPDGKIEHDYIQKERFFSLCAMEYVYFSRPDSVIEGINVHNARKRFGEELAKEHPVKADLVIGVPDSSLSSALGYANFVNIPYEFGLIKNKYIGRSFIAPSQEEREKIIRLKLNANVEVLKGKDIILIDDSIVRGTTMKGIVKILKAAGVKKIHIRIASAEIKHPCFYGVDISNTAELALNKYTKAEYIKILKYVDSLEFLSKEGMQKALGRNVKDNKLCMACFSGKYPIDLSD